MQKIPQKSLYLVIALLTIVLVFVIFQNYNRAQIISAVKDLKEQKNLDHILQWKFYEHKESGIRIKYPEGTEIEEYEHGASFSQGPIRRIIIEEISEVDEGTAGKDGKYREFIFDQLVSHRGFLAIGKIYYAHYLDDFVFSRAIIREPQVTRNALLVVSSVDGKPIADATNINYYSLYIKEDDILKKTHGKRYFYIIEFSSKNFPEEESYQDLLQQIITFAK